MHRKGLIPNLISSDSAQKLPKDETVPDPDNGIPARLDNSQQPTFVELPAMICQPANPQPQFKSNIKTASLNGRSSGKTFQMTFHESYFVVVQS